MPFPLYLRQFHSGSQVIVLQIDFHLYLSTSTSTHSFPNEFLACLFRKAVLARLNTFGCSHASEYDRMGRRDFALCPLLLGESMCTRQDCIYALERKWYVSHPPSSKAKRPSNRWQSSDRLGPVLTAMSKTVTSINPPKHERYRTSIAAVEVLLGALEARGYDFGLSNNVTADISESNRGESGRLSQSSDVADHVPSLIVADICGCPQDSIAKALLKSTNCLLVCNDFHARKSTMSHIFMSKLDASLPTFPDAFRIATSIIFLPSQNTTTNIDVIITSPPFSLAIPILLNAFCIATSLVAMKLPMQFLCPGPTCLERREFLVSHPPSAIIPLSRCDNREFYNISIDEAWFVWLIPVGKMSCPPLLPFSFYYPTTIR